MKKVLSLRNILAFLMLFTTMSSAASEVAVSSDAITLKKAEQLAASNKVDASLILLDGLNKKNKLSIDKNLLLLTLGRVTYQKNKLNQAISYYDQVSKSSDFWSEAQEEKAWAFAREKNYDGALSPLKSLFTSIFVPQIGPETYVLSAFVDYKVCDYKRSYEKILDFKNEMLPRVSSLEAISAQPNNALASKWLSKMETQTLTSADLGKDLQLLPRFFYRDEILAKALRAGNMRAAQARMQSLAKVDLADISKNLNKMKIIEVEIIQRSFGYDKKNAQGDLSFDSAKTDETAKRLNVKKSEIITFPEEKDSKEVWIDEIGKYQVKTQKCPTNPGGHT